MLSGETAGGLYPVEAVETMARVATFTESNFTPKSYEDVDAESTTTTESIGKAVVKIAKDLHAAAIIASTERGGTAQMISKFRPACPIVAVSPHEAIVRRLQLTGASRLLLVKKRTTLTPSSITLSLQPSTTTSSKPVTSSSSRPVSPLPKPVRPT